MRCDNTTILGRPLPSQAFRGSRAFGHWLLDPCCFGCLESRFYSILCCSIKHNDDRQEIMASCGIQVTHHGIATIATRVIPFAFGQDQQHQKSLARHCYLTTEAPKYPSVCLVKSPCLQTRCVIFGCTMQPKGPLLPSTL